ncbi:MAG: hypothetical protein IT264_16055 [Saprospiraceae bacterium]|nr:hypothetical protein [Saprospiraceae bacterium]
MKILFSTILVLQLSFSYSQIDFKTVDVDKISKSFIIDKFLGYKDGIYYFQYLIIKNIVQFDRKKTQGLGVVMFDKDLKEIRRFEVSGKEKKENLIATYFKDGKLHLIASYDNKENKIINHYSFDNSGNRIGAIELLVTDEDSNIDVDFSLDSSKILIVNKFDPNTKNENCKLDACVIDKDGNLQWKKSSSLGNSKEFDFKAFKINNEGNLYVIMQALSKNDAYSYNLFNLNKNGSHTTKLVTSGYIGIVKMYETEDGCYLTGFNYNLKKGIHVNPFLVRINDKKTELIVPNESINEDYLAPLIKNKFYKDKDGWSEYTSLVHAWKNDKSEHRIVWEASYLSIEKVGGIQYKYNECKHYFMFIYDANETLKDIKICPKELATDADYFIYPVQSFVQNDIMYAVFNEQENNINLTSIDKWKNKGDQIPILRRFKPDGSIKDIKLNKNLNNQGVIPNASGLTSEGNLIFYFGEFKFLKIKDFKIGLININNFEK